MAPVDHVSHAIISICGYRKWGKAYHIWNPESMSVREIADTISTMGYKIDIISYAEWRERLMEAAEVHSDHPLFPLLSYFEGPFPHTSRTYGTEEANVLLEHKQIFCCAISQELVIKYINFFVKKKLLFLPNK